MSTWATVEFGTIKLADRFADDQRKSLWDKPTVSIPGKWSSWIKKGIIVVGSKILVLGFILKEGCPDHPLYPRRLISADFLI